MHVLLTGQVQVGKTTALTRFLEKFGVTADGYRTYWRDCDILLIAPYGLPDGAIVAATTKENGQRSPVLEAFDVFGAELVENSGKKDIIVFDELGRLETGAVHFTSAVLKKFDGNIPILGVIKPEHNSFLDSIRSKPNVKVIEVTTANRDSVPDLIAEYLDVKSR